MQNLYFGSPCEWLQRLTGHEKVAGSTPVWGSEIVFLRRELDDRSSIILHSLCFQILSVVKQDFILFKTFIFMTTSPVMK